MLTISKSKAKSRLLSKAAKTKAKSWLLLLVLAGAGVFGAQSMLLQGLCFAQASVSISISPSKSWESSKEQQILKPVMVEGRLYLAINIQGEKFHLWRLDPNAPTQDWQEINLGGSSGIINDPNATALGSHGGYLYLATKKEGERPHLWRLQDPNQGVWKPVGPPEIGLAKTITSLCSFDRRLYLGSGSGQEEGDLEGLEVQLWRSTETETYNQELSSATWKPVSDVVTSALISSDFQEFEAKLYLGIESRADNQKKAEVLKLDPSTASPYRYNIFGQRESNQSVTALAVCDQTLYAATRNNDYGAQVWFLIKGGKDFSRLSSWDSFINPNRSYPRSLESLGSYLFLGFDTPAGVEIFRLSANPDHLENRQKEWGKVSIIYDQAKDQPLLADKSNRLCWLYADQSNGYLFLGTKDSSGAFTLWKSDRLPIITITSPQYEYQSHPPYAYLGAFGPKSGKFQVSWRSTRSGNYLIHQLQLKDPNNQTNTSPGFLFREQGAEKGKIYTSPKLPPGDEQGTYVAEIVWDPNQASLPKEQGRYPVLFSFIYDTKGPECLPVVTSLTPGNRKLRVRWAAAHDKLSGVAHYRILWKESPKEADANSIPFSYKDLPEESKEESKYEYEISGLINGRRYMVAVLAVDRAGNESALSPITDKSFATPQAGQSLTDLVGESGGCFLKALGAKKIHTMISRSRK